MKSIPGRYWLAVAAVHGLAVLIAWVVGLWLWFSADALVFGYALAFVAPVAFAVFVASFVVDPSRTSDAFVHAESDTTAAARMLMALGPFVLVALVAGTVLYLGWSSPSLRATALKAVAGFGWVEPAENGLLGVSDEVRLAACEVAQNRDLSAERLWASIASSKDPEVTECLLGVMPAESGRAAVIRGLARQWGRELTQDVTPEAACRKANWIGQTDRLGNDGAAAELLDCALGAPLIESQICCAQNVRALTRGAPVHSVLPGPRTFLESSETGRLEDWMRLARPGALDPRVSEFLDWSGAANRSALNSLSCHLLETHEPALGVMEAELREVPACRTLKLDRQILRTACVGPTDIESMCTRARAEIRVRAASNARAAVGLASSLGRLNTSSSMRFTGGDPANEKNVDMTRLMLERMQRDHGKPVDFKSLDLLEFMKQQRTPK